MASAREKAEVRGETMPMSRGGVEVKRRRRRSDGDCDILDGES